ncbi:MAG: L-methionine (R)-S-oxide reductase, partial [Reinekea sp.]
MAEELLTNTGADRRSRYQQLLAQLQALTAGEPNRVANLANVAAALRQTFGFFWVGFYLVDGDEL